jgi:hypothetical protein
MKFASWILGPPACPPPVPSPTTPGQCRLDPSKLNLNKGHLQPRTQGMLDYLVGTLRKTW